MKQRLQTSVVFLLAFLLGCGTLNNHAYAIAISGVTSMYGQGDNIAIDYTADMEQGVLLIGTTGTKNDVSIGVIKNGETDNYRLKSGESTQLPFNKGDGDYDVVVRAYVEGNLTEPIWRESLQVKMPDSDNPWLSPSKIVNWSEDMRLTETAAALKKESDGETAMAFLEYIVDNKAYDETIIPPPGYIPDLERVYQEENGICYDFTALYTAMCRSVGIPCKLVMGYVDYTEGVYHSWCYVYADGAWKMVDPIYSMQKGVEFVDRLEHRMVEMKVY
jgi:hypothetical protein